MILSERIDAIHTLGLFLRHYLQRTDDTPTFPKNFYTSFDAAIIQATQQNAWFTQDNIHFALSHWAEILTKAHLHRWLESYAISDKVTNPKQIAIIMAGNIPLVGFHDFLCVFLSGHSALIKLSSRDAVLLPFLIDFLVYSEPKAKPFISWSEQFIRNFDAIIATGSNNSARYFSYYFEKYPHIIRKNRTSVAVLTGDESSEELYHLGLDIFSYYGLGCRNVSKIFIPYNFDLQRIFDAWTPYQSVIDNHKYANNYDYYRAIYLLNKEDFLDNNFLILRKNSAYYSPVGTLHYETYENLNSIDDRLKKDSDSLQCVVKQSPSLRTRTISMGHSQSPTLGEYADDVDTLQFLITL